MQLVIDPHGAVGCVDGEALDLGVVSIRRASHVEPDAAGAWWVGLALVGGPTLAEPNYGPRVLIAGGDFAPAQQTA